MSKSLVVKRDSFMFLLLAGLALFLIIYFTVASISNSNSKSDSVSIIKGILIGDSTHVFPCNQIVKADYVLRDLTIFDQCLPVIAESKVANRYLGQKVVLKGSFLNSAYHASEFTLIDR